MKKYVKDFVRKIPHLEHGERLKNLQHMLYSTPLRKIADELNINLKTAFHWRHRFVSVKCSRLFK